MRIHLTSLVGIALTFMVFSCTPAQPSSEELFEEAWEAWTQSVSQDDRGGLDRAAFRTRLVACGEGEEVRLLRSDAREFFAREDVLELCARWLEATRSQR